MSTEPNKIIYSMVGVSKFYDKKPVLKDIYLSYFYGAKIGVIGLNGSGKSSLLRILAGVDKDFNGETVISPGFTVGFLEQEPLIDDARTVREVVEEAVQETVSLLKEFDEINTKFGEEMSDDEMSALLERQGEVQEKLDALDAWDLDSRLEMAMDALRCPPPDAPVKVLSGGERRRVVSFVAPEAGHPVTRRANQPSRRRVSRMARASPAWLRGNGHRRHTRSLLPRQRRGLDSRARPRPGNSVEGKLQLLARTETGAPAPRGEIRDGKTENAATRARMDSHVAESPSCKGQSEDQLLRRSAATGE